MRNIGLAIVLLVWLLLGWKMCQDQQNCCPSDAVSQVVDPVKATPVPAPPKATCTTGYVCFEDGSCDPIYADNFNTLRDSLLALVASGKKLIITGHFASTENYSGTSTASDLGMCRAEAIRQGLGSRISNDQVTLASQRTVGRTLAPHERVSFSTGASDVVVADKTLIYFPSNSTNKLSDREIERYLDDVALRVKASGERVQLTGHTDSQGSEAYNFELGRQRAIVIRTYLVSKGVASNNIIIKSDGESSPVATNDTEEGRAQNRRTELEII